MSLALMKARMDITGKTAREEMIRDGQNHFAEELEHDPSYSPTIFFYVYNNNVGTDDRPAKLRIYGRKYSTIDGNSQKFATTHDNPVKIGDYFHDTKDNTFWIVDSVFDLDDINIQGKMIQCNYNLRWQLSNGKIVERWASIFSSSKYGVGVDEGKAVTLTTNNYSIRVQYSEEAMQLEYKRVFIDKREKNPERVFLISRCDDILYDYGERGAYLNFIADKTELNKSTDNQELRICDYIKTDDPIPTPSPQPDPQPTEPDEPQYAVVLTGNLSLYVGIEKTWNATVLNQNGEKVAFEWNVDSDIDFDKKKIDGDMITLTLLDEDMVGESFNLQILVDGKVIEVYRIVIKEVW